MLFRPHLFEIITGRIINIDIYIVGVLAKYIVFTVYEKFLMIDEAIKNRSII